jgi:hypothetical protein
MIGTQPSTGQVSVLRMGDQCDLVDTFHFSTFLKISFLEL